MSIISKIEAFLRKKEIFLYEEVARFGSKNSVYQALSFLITDGKILRISKGIYARAKKSLVTGNIIPIQGLDTIKKAINKLGYEIIKDKFYTEYDKNLSTQVPTGRVIKVNKNSKRVFSYNNVYIFLNYSK